VVYFPAVVSLFAVIGVFDCVAATISPPLVGGIVWYWGAFIPNCALGFFIESFERITVVQGFSPIRALLIAQRRAKQLLVLAV
jgi:hypothetical protein